MTDRHCHPRHLRLTPVQRHPTGADRHIVLEGQQVNAVAILRVIARVVSELLLLHKHVVPQKVDRFHLGAVGHLTHDDRQAAIDVGKVLGRGHRASTASRRACSSVSVASSAATRSRSLTICAREAT